jgi:drug/metabolite transporter (DMT)-like permease
MTSPPAPGLSPRSAALLGFACGGGAALSWAAGFAAAKHALDAGLAPADLALHRFAVIGLLVLPRAAWEGFADLGGVGWPRALVLALLAGPGQVLLSFTGFTLAPFGHGALIAPTTSMVVGLVLAALLLKETISRRHVLGATTITLGLLLLVGEAVLHIGGRGLAGDFLFVAAGTAWSIFAMLLRRWRIAATRAVAVIGVVSLLVYAPLHAVFIGYERILAAGLWENLVQVIIQGGLAGMAAIYLFTRAVTLIGVGRASVFATLVPPLTLLLGFLVLGEVPSLIQFIGLGVIGIGLLVFHAGAARAT